MVTSRPNDSPLGSPDRNRLFDEAALRILRELKTDGNKSIQLPRGAKDADKLDGLMLVADIKPDPKDLLKPKPESV